MTGPDAHSPAQPPYPPAAAAPPDPPRRRRGPTLAIAVAALIGLVVGAGVVGGLWLATNAGETAGAQPIPVDLNTLPAQVLGKQRDDLALQASDNAKAKDNGKRQSELYVTKIDAYRSAYGGPGIDASYGVMEGEENYRLLIVNGIQPLPLVTPDAIAEFLGALGPTDGVQAPGTATTHCVALPGGAIVTVNKEGGVIAARQQVLDDPRSIVTCVRSDRGRNLSVQLQSFASSESAPTANDRAARMAAEVDRIWASLPS